VFLIK